ncbi:MAG: hypothetical protein AAF630_09840 [Cyanobacteria bacterium P01_C01_bin.38]
MTLATRNQLNKPLFKVDSIDACLMHKLLFLLFTTPQKELLRSIN